MHNYVISGQVGAVLNLAGGSHGSHHPPLEKILHRLRLHPQWCNAPFPVNKRLDTRDSRQCAVGVSTPACIGFRIEMFKNVVGHKWSTRGSTLGRLTNAEMQFRYPVPTGNKTRSQSCQHLEQKLFQSKMGAFNTRVRPTSICSDEVYDTVRMPCLE